MSGASASITGTANTGAATLPLTISLPDQSDERPMYLIDRLELTTTINANATPTFAIFVTVIAGVPFVP